MNRATLRKLAAVASILALLAVAAPASGWVVRDAQYERAMDALDDRDWRAAVDLLRQVERRGSEKADAAVYWQAYALGKLGRVDAAVEALDRLSANFPASEWRDDGRKLLAELRRESGPQPEGDDLKIAVLTAMVHSDPDRALPVLRKFLSGDHASELKEQALFLLIQTGAPDALQVTGELARGSDPALQRSAIHSLGMFGGDRSDRILSELYGELDDEELKREILGSFMMRGDTERLVAAARGESSAALRREAIHLLGAMGATVELDALYEREPSVELREALLHSFMMSGDTERIFDAAREESSTELREQAIHLLGVMGGTAELTELYEDEASVDIREAILHSFMVSGDKQRVLEAAGGEASTELRESAMHLLGMMGARDELWNLYQRESSRDVRQSILHALSMSGEVERLAEVARSDDDAGIRSEAIVALGMSGGTRVDALLLEIYRSENDRAVRSSVLQSMAMQGNVQALIRIARTEKDRELKREAIRALSMSGSKDATDFLLELLDER